jgi:hypothetical protein
MNALREDLDALLHPFTTETLEQCADAVYAFDREGHLLYVNQAWGAFATANDGEPGISAHWDVGTDVFSAVPAPLQPFYRRLLAEAQHAGRDAASPVRHAYECSSPSLYRRFQMTVYPLTGDRGFLVVNALLVEHPHDPEDRAPFPASDAYRDAAGIVHQCCHCRRTSNLAHPGRWDWVPAWVERLPPRTSHTLCEPCFAFYYGPLPPVSR